MQSQTAPLPCPTPAATTEACLTFSQRVLDSPMLKGTSLSWSFTAKSIHILLRSYPICQLPTHIFFLGRLSLRRGQPVLVHIISPVTDNCLILESAEGGEWPEKWSISTKSYVAKLGLEPATLDLQTDALPTALWCPGDNISYKTVPSKDSD